MYQFVHVESYSRTAPKAAESKNKKTGQASGKAGRSVSWVVNEAIRDPGAIPHIESPQGPIYLHGEPLEQLEATCESWASSMTDARGRKLRKDALCLAAGIVSAPNDIDPQAWEAFKRDALQWLKNKYGDSLRTVIEHVDESHPHLHFYCVPQPGQRFETVHEGKAAAAEAKAQGKAKGLQNQAYKSAMRTYQDDFYDQVGIEHGFTRLGPGKRRLTREEWKQEQHQAAYASAAIGKAKAMTCEAEIESATIIGDAKAQAQAVAATAMEKADAVEREAEQRGFEKGIAATDALPWWQRVRLFVGAVAKERDALRSELEAVTGERDELATKNESLTEKVKRYFKAGKAAVNRVRELEPALADALSRAEDAAIARRQVDDLRDALGSASDRAKHWEAVAQAHMPEHAQQPTMHVPGDKKKNSTCQTWLRQAVEKYFTHIKCVQPKGTLQQGPYFIRACDFGHYANLKAAT
nr:plasmid recombination protein [Pseudomonas syringae group genomosp. 3]